MKKTITLNFTLAQIQQILQDGNYVSPEETLDEVSFSKETGVTFTFSDKRFEVGNKDDKDEMKKLLETPLVDCNISVPILNILKAAKISTLGELTEYSPADLIKFRRIGHKAIANITKLLQSKGLKLKES